MVVFPMNCEKRFVIFPFIGWTSAVCLRILSLINMVTDLAILVGMLRLQFNICWTGIPSICEKTGLWNYKASMAGWFFFHLYDLLSVTNVAWMTHFANYNTTADQRERNITLNFNSIRTFFTLYSRSWFIPCGAWEVKIITIVNLRVDSSGK